MRAAKKFYLLLPFLMVVILLCGQLPELLTLTDDISNDFEEESLAHVPESVKVTTLNATSQKNIIVFEQESNGIALARPPMQLAPSFPLDVLHLLSIQRK